MKKKKTTITTQMNNILNKMDDFMTKLYELNYNELKEEELIELQDNVEGYIDVLILIKVDVESLRGKDSGKIGMSDDLDIENQKGIIIY